mgnify:CR=1 FL=1
MQFTILFLIFIPLIEIYFMIKIGTVIGAFNTILATLLTAAVGLYFVRIQGISMLYSAANTVRNNQEPLKEILTDLFPTHQYVSHFLLSSLLSDRDVNCDFKV